MICLHTWCGWWSDEHPFVQHALFLVLFVALITVSCLTLLQHTSLGLSYPFLTCSFYQGLLIQSFESESTRLTICSPYSSPPPIAIIRSWQVTLRWLYLLPDRPILFKLSSLDWLSLSLCLLSYLLFVFCSVFSSSLCLLFYLLTFPLLTTLFRFQCVPQPVRHVAIGHTVKHANLAAFSTSITSFVIRHALLAIMRTHQHGLVKVCYCSIWLVGRL